MVFLCGSVLYRAGAGWHGNAIKKTAFRLAGPNAHCFVLFASFAAFKKKPTVYRAADQQPQYQAERARCAGYGLVKTFGIFFIVPVADRRKGRKLAWGARF